ncbi:hypothetical protein PF001_g27791, partial [Phytophthora fragariae]
MEVETVPPAVDLKEMAKQLTKMLKHLLTTNRQLENDAAEIQAGMDELHRMQETASLSDEVHKSIEDKTRHYFEFCTHDSSSSQKAPTLSSMPAALQSKRSSFRPIPDRYETLAEVQQDLRKAGLESSDLVVGIDFTKSNQWTGERSLGGRCLHDIDPSGVFMNPYQSVISVIGRVLEAFDDDNIIPAFGFGDMTTKGDRCFPFTSGRGCHGFEEVLRRYNEITPSLKLSGPTNFAPVIKETIRAVQQSGGYHILVIIADGQVTNEEATREAIVEASNWPISIIMVGVGDGPWNMMEEFDDKLPARRFDNFQFVEYNAVMQLNKKNPEAGFAIMALMEIP